MMSLSDLVNPAESLLMWQLEETMKKLVSMLLLLSMCTALVSCGEASSDTAEVYHVGILQLAPHVALDAATQGFQDALIDKLIGLVSGAEKHMYQTFQYLVKAEMQ